MRVQTSKLTIKLTSLLLAALLAACEGGSNHGPSPTDSTITPKLEAGSDSSDGGATGLARGLVASYHAESTAAGIELLKAGGNAFDAFVAATFMDYVVSPGATSAAGPLGALVHVQAEGKVLYLDGDLNEVLDPGGAWTPADPSEGKAFSVPGAVAALAELSRRYGALKLARALEPAIRAARDGFVVSQLYSAAIQQQKTWLKRSTYGKQTYFPGGQVIAPGSTLKLPQLAAFLQGLASQGAAYMYSGSWAAEAVKAVNASGGNLSSKDLARYKPAWRAPRGTTYRGHEVLASSGRAYGGLWALVGLEVLEQTQLKPLGHYSRRADPLELMVRTARTLHTEPWFFDAKALDDPSAVAKRLAPPYTTSLWQRLHKALKFSPPGPQGSHSFHVVTADREGNVVTGTNTIEGQAFGEGIFVQGVALNAAAKLTGYRSAPGERRISPLSVHVVRKGGRLVAAFGAFGTSMIEVELAMLVDALDYGMAGPAIAASPRYGTFPYDWSTGTSDTTKNWLDPAIPQDVVTTLAQRGLLFEQDPYADLGFGVALTIDDGGEPRAGAIRTYGYPVFIEAYPPR